MIKAARKAAAHAGLARAFADIFTNRLRFVSAAHYEQCIASQSIRATQRRGTRLQRGGVRMRALIIHVYGHQPMATNMNK